MIDTPDLITRLGHDLAPVRRLRKPLVRALIWLGFAGVLMGCLALAEGLRPDLAIRVRVPAFSLALVGMAVTAILATIAAFMLSLPDRSRLWFLAPLPGLALWLGNIGWQCASGLLAPVVGDMGGDDVARCVATLILASLPLSLSLMLLLRHALRLAPMPVALSAALAIAAFATMALTLCHHIDASLLILGWNLGTILFLTGAAGLIARRSGGVAEFGG